LKAIHNKNQGFTAIEVFINQKGAKIMCVIVKINKDEFVQAFDKTDRGNNFTTEAREALFGYLDDFEEDIELDVIALCCDYTESTTAEILQNYSELDEELSEKDLTTKKEVEDYIK